MLFKDYDIIRTLAIIYLVMWLIPVIRYLVYTYLSKNYNVLRAKRLASTAVTCRKLGWLVFFTLPIWVFLFPYVTIINQNTELEIIENVDLGSDNEDQSTNILMVRETFNPQRRCALFTFKGKFLAPGNYVYNNTDSVLNIYHTEFKAYTPVYVDSVNGGIDVAPGELIKFSKTIRQFFTKPEPDFTPEKVLNGTWTIDVKSFANFQKERIKQEIAYKKTTPSWFGEDKESPLSKRGYNASKIESMAIQNGQNIRELKPYDSIQHIVLTPPESSHSPYKNSARDSFYQQTIREFEQMHRELDSVKRRFDKISSSTNPQGTHQQVTDQKVSNEPDTKQTIGNQSDNSQPPAFQLSANQPGERQIGGSQHSTNN